MRGHAAPQGAEEHRERHRFEYEEIPELHSRPLVPTCPPFNLRPVRDSHCGGHHVAAAAVLEQSRHDKTGRVSTHSVELEEIARYQRSIVVPLDNHHLSRVRALVIPRGSLLRRGKFLGDVGGAGERD